MLRLEDYRFDLPKDLIAQEPLARRDASRLMILHPEGPIHGRFDELPDRLRRGDMVVVNETRVVPARFACRRRTGARVEGLLVSRGASEGALSVMLRSSAKLVEGERLELDGFDGGLKLEEKGERGHWTARLEGADLRAWLAEVGRAPLPPYIRRDGVRDARDADDLDRYQTVYAREPGAIAAPTAGLHFTDAIFAALAERGIGLARLTLHVGLGTFLPVRSDDITEHRMSAERYRIGPEDAERIRTARREGGRIIAVGTTTCRALEASRIHECGGPVEGDTDLFIYPGHEFRAIDGLLTNFHMPESTLLMLVAALAGRERLLDAYRCAVETGYRFFSYGDAMLVWPAGVDSGKQENGYGR